MSFPRSSGILLHITSLPSPYGIGDLGPGAYRIADFLREARQGIWQVLPLVPVGHGNSPYSSPSTFAGNPFLISPELLEHDRLLDAGDLANPPDFPPGHVEYERAIPYKQQLLHRAYQRFKESDPTHLKSAFEWYCSEHESWLEDYALFMTLKNVYGGGSWTGWPSDLVHREPRALEHARLEHADEVDMHRFWQFLFHRQWSALKSYCNERDIRIFGDIPIYVAHDSADVWAEQELFYLDQDGNPTVVAGVPPDYFSETGQRWGNPIYRWDRMKENGYNWWTRRITATLKQVDIVRLDHFRGFEAYWEIPASEPTAVMGRWVKGPGAELFRVVRERLGSLPVVAEDLGLITPEVTEIMHEMNFPGMVVLQFAFDSDNCCAYLPHNFKRNAVAYTGTHDNDTTIGWWHTLKKRADADASSTRELAFARRYLHLNGAEDSTIQWEAIRAVVSSVADLAVIPMQDALGLGSEARMNQPGKSENNWAWRMEAEALTDDLARRLRELTITYGRASEEPTEQP